MKLTNILLILSLIMMGVSCSNNEKDSSQEMIDEAKTDVAEGADFIVDGDDSIEDDLLIDDTEEISAVSDKLTEASDMVQDAVAEVDIMKEDPIAAMDVSDEGLSGEYKAQKGDTLMLVAFKVFGDYKRWKELVASNPGISSNLKAGDKIKYQGSMFNWQPEGLSYLIKNGDTLGTISNDKYGTPNKWKSIWNNNKPLIKDPNLIFAGFTIYYIPGLDVASN